MWRRPWRIFSVLATIGLLLWFSYLLWSPGERVTDGSHDRAENGIWLGHGWLGDDAWFARYDKEDELPSFRTDEAVRDLADRLAAHHFVDVFPHLAPCSTDGELLDVDHEQARRFLRALDGFRVMPWVGGVWQVHAAPNSEQWRERFVGSIVDLLARFPQLAGIHVNIEPLPSGDADFLTLLEELRAAMPAEKILSVAAFPPPMPLRGDRTIHWDVSYIRDVAGPADQLVFMMYDTSLPLSKPYRWLVAHWVEELVRADLDASLLFGLPAYDDEDAPWHNARVESLANGLLGVHAGLPQHLDDAGNYQGIAVYSEWEMDPAEWDVLRDEFVAHSE